MKPQFQLSSAVGRERSASALADWSPRRPISDDVDESAALRPGLRWTSTIQATPPLKKKTVKLNTQQRNQVSFSLLVTKGRGHHRQRPGGAQVAQLLLEPRRWLKMTSLSVDSQSAKKKRLPTCVLPPTLTRTMYQVSFSLLVTKKKKEKEKNDGDLFFFYSRKDIKKITRTRAWTSEGLDKREPNNEAIQSILHCSRLLKKKN